MNSSTGPAPSHLAEKHEESIGCSPLVHLRELIFPLLLRGARGPAGQQEGPRRTRGHRRYSGPPYPTPRESLWAAQRPLKTPSLPKEYLLTISGLHDVLAANVTRLGFVFKLARATRF